MRVRIDQGAARAAATDLGESDRLGTLPEALPADVEAVLEESETLGRATWDRRAGSRRTLRMRPAGWVHTRLLDKHRNVSEWPVGRWAGDVRSRGSPSSSRSSRRGNARRSSPRLPMASPNFDISSPVFGMLLHPQCVPRAASGPSPTSRRRQIANPSRHALATYQDREPLPYFRGRENQIASCVMLKVGGGEGGSKGVLDGNCNTAKRRAGPNAGRAGQSAVGRLAGLRSSGGLDRSNTHVVLCRRI